MKTLSLEQVITMHNKTIDLHGGSYGVRDITLVQSALARPFTTFDGIDLYETIYDKIASITESLICNHAFVDGNKRIGTVVMIVICRENGLKFVASHDETINFILGVASGDSSVENISNWIKNNTVK